MNDVQDTQVSPRSRLMALFLCLILGWIGVHRFYLDRAGTGFAMFFTMGGFGVWWFIDIILITIGLLNDNDGLPVKNWV